MLSRVCLGAQEPVARGSPAGSPQTPLNPGDPCCSNGSWQDHEYAQASCFRPWQPEQTSPLPPSPSDWLSDDHQVYVLLDLVDELDLSAILIPAQSKDPRREKGFAPRMWAKSSAKRLQSDGHSIQGYNCQLAVDSDHQMIRAIGMSNQSPDTEHLEPMLDRIAANAGELPDVMTTDAYFATGRLTHGQPPPKRGPLPKNADSKTRMARKRRRKEGSTIRYACLSMQHRESCPRRNTIDEQFVPLGNQLG